MMVVGGASGGDHVGILWPGLVFALAILVPPIVVSTRKTNFEVRRWEDSDHPMTSSDDGDEDDE